MLLTLALTSSQARILHATGTPRVAACSDSDPALFQDAGTVDQAAQLCAACPLATPCLIGALRVDAAYRNGADPWGVFGTFAGLWFTHSSPPARIAFAPTAAAPA